MTADMTELKEKSQNLEGTFGMVVCCLVGGFLGVGCLSGGCLGVGCLGVGC